MLSTGFPLLYVVGAIFYFVFYWVYKVLLMNYYMKTTSFNEDLAIKSLKVIEFGLILKIFMGSLMLSNKAIFGSSSDFRSNYFYSVVTDFLGQEGTSRFSSNHSILYMGICLVLVIILLCNKVLITFLFFMVKSLINLLQGRGNVIEHEGVEEEGDFYKDLSLAYLQKTYHRFVQEKEDFIKDFASLVCEDSETVSEGFIYTCKDLNMDKVAWMQYKEWYSIRIRHIKKVID